ncbi:hypothetical protein JIN85_13195 [Luteolibacter pohnpeiensis]|uniref:Uncharacterized protein n=1 Tax=Luteolibacter pohnpeiensis TaxID=454153 RepID=A0A934SBZ9_9BACT|nr:hypothetical protein [Luteolibacter pohnpeiensis]MBK1883377.1 hypothetical protein [Luteolibacter pohnpeiensis]
MKTILCFFLLALRLFAAEPCPVCGGELTTVGMIKDDLSKPNKNEWVWRGSPECGLQMFNDDSPICKRCWFVSDGGTPVWWRRSSELPDSFLVPFSVAIRNFPVPPKSASYEQRFVEGTRTESIHFWCDDSPELIAKFRKYCIENNLSIDISAKHDGQVFIDIEPVVGQQGGAGQPAATSESDSEGGENHQPESDERSQ